VNKLFIALLGGRPPDSTIEAHNVFFGIGPDMESLFPSIKKFWPSAPAIHIDAYLCVEHVDGHQIIIEKNDQNPPSGPQAAPKLFFVNLGGYREGVFEERHKKLLLVADNQAEATAMAKRDPFFKEGVQHPKARPHIDDRKLLEAFEDELPLDVGEMIRPGGFRLLLRPDCSKHRKFPKPIITGFWKIP
jgi:hypothetical protein